MNNDRPFDLEETAPQSAKKSLVRKALIISGAVAGIAIAGGFAYLKTQAPTEDETDDCGCPLVDDAPESE